MRRQPALLLVALTTLLPAAPLAAQARANSLAARLDRMLDGPPFDRALWGVAIADPSGRIVYERNGSRLFVPASSTKIIVSAAALWLLPADYRFRTSVYAAGPVADGVIRGDLVLYGRGDPTLSGRFARSRTRPLEDLADSLRARGVGHIEGDVVGDASWFDSTTVHPDWEGGDLVWGFAAPVSALGFNDNAVDVRITPTGMGARPLLEVDPDFGALLLANRARTVPRDSARRFDLRRVLGSNVVAADGDVPADARPRTESLAVPDGALYAAEAFRRALEARGITVAGRARSLYDPAAYAAARRDAPLAERRSPPLDSVLVPILETSNNWYAEMLLKTLGRELTGSGSWDSALALERRWLADSVRLDTTMVHLSDASGLSHHDLVSPRAFVQLLRRMRTHPRFEAFRNALPEGGREGTLRTRFRRSAVIGRVTAKTGSIGNVNTLTGYVEKDGELWAFAIQINNHAARSRDATQRIDEIVEAIVR